MINLTDYWMDRDSRYRSECTEAIQRNARSTVDKVNRLLELAERDGIIADKVSSGWRPQSVNDATRNAAKGSTHLNALAVDLADPERKLAQWCINHQAELALCQLWMEDHRWTPTWLHLQTIPPKSGKRIYIPNTKPPIAVALEGQKPIPTFLRV